MEQFLLTIVIVLLLAIVLIIHAVRLIFRVSHPYAHGVVPGGGVPASGRSGGSGLGFIIILLIIGLAYLSFDAGKKEEVARQLPAPEQPVPDPQPEVQEPYTPREYVSDEAGPVQITMKPRFIDRPMEDWEIDRLNQSPEDALPPVFWAIQLHAIEKADFAKAAASKLSKQFDHLAIIFLPEDAPHKIIIGPFSNRAAAVRHKRQNNTGGFIKEINRLK